MSARSLPARGALTALLALVACADGSVDLPRSTEATALRRAGTGAATSDALAAALLEAAGTVPGHSSLPRVPRPLDRAVVDRAVGHALDHLRAAALGTGDGAALAGSARIRRLASGPGAPPDRDGNGTNLDEALADEVAALGALAGLDPVPERLAPTFATRAGATAVLADPAGPRDALDLGALRTVPHDGTTIPLLHLAHALRLRVHAGATLGRGRRETLVGETAQDGAVALLALQQALAIEETVLGSLTFDGESLGRLADPGAYDPNAGARWIPGSVAFVAEPALRNAPAAWIPVDRQSDLGGAAALLRAAVELAWLTDPDNPEPQLRELFVDTPLAPPVNGGTPLEVTSWSGDVRPILHGRAGCLGCHAPPAPNSGFSVATYDDVLRGGNSGVPAVVPFDHESSPLWLVLNGPWTPPNRSRPIPRMPFGGDRLPQGQIDTVRRWIDGGALRDPPPAPPPQRPGLGLARVLFRNLVALHEVRDGPRAGLLDRRSGTSRSELVGAAETGAALSAVAAFATVDGEEPGIRDALEAWSTAAAATLAPEDGAFHAEWDLRVDLPTAASPDLGSRASLAAGLLAAGRVTARTDVTARGLAIGRALLADSWHEDEGLFDTLPGAAARRLTAANAAAVLDLLREMQLAGDGTARDVAQRFLTTVLGTFSFSELEGRGERIGDGIPDTDGNGVVEPGANGRAPLLADALVEGPGEFDDPNAPITWSRHVLPVFRVRCAGCHVDGASQGGYRVDTPGLAATPGASGLAPIVAGDPGASLLFQKLAQRSPPTGAQMPLARPPLEPHELEVVRRWILDGARDR